MKNLSLSLYAFHLRQTLTDAPDRVADDAALLWDNLTNLGHFPGLNTLKSHLICYTNTEYIPENEPGQKTYWLTHAQDIDLGAISTADGFKITANLQPFRLNDTYAIDLTLSPDSPHLDITIPQIALDYARCLRDLRAHHTAMETNLTNFDTKKGNIAQIGTIPQFWDEFLRQSHVWKQQIQTDINYLSPGQDLFGQMLETVRGIVDLDQAERDTFRRSRLRQRTLDEKLQNLELWIAVVGTGLAVSGISSQVDSQPIQTFIQNQTNSDTPICPGAGVVKCTAYNGINVFIHIIIALLIALPIGCIIQWMRDRHKRRG
jgi:hypothetical protein